MARNKVIPYNPKLKEYASQLRQNSTLTEVLLWKYIKNKAFGVKFLRFTTNDIKNEMFSVLLVIRDIVQERINELNIE